MATKTTQAVPEYARGMELVKKAEDKVKAWSLFSNSNKEQAVELFDKAAAQFKIAKEWEVAAKAHIRAAEVCEKYLRSESDATMHYLSAAKSYKLVSPRDAIRMFKLVAGLHMENNRFSTAARLHKEIAELEEKENNISAAMEAYSQSADCFLAEDNPTNANQCLLKIAHYAALRDDYKKAIEVYEKVASSSRNNKLMTFAAKEHFLKAGICHLVMGAKSGDTSPLGIAIARYKDLSFDFSRSRECQFLESVLAAFDSGSASKYTDTVFQYDRVSPLDTWTAQLLLEVKRILRGDGGTAAVNAAMAAIHIEPDLQGTGSAAAPSAPPADALQ